MMLLIKLLKFALPILGMLLLFACGDAGGGESQGKMTDEALHQKANKLAHQFIITDGHIDVPYRMREHMEDISVRTEGGDFDYVRATEGGLNVPFMSIYVPAEYQKKGGAAELADSLIDMVYGFSSRWPVKFAIAKSTDDVYRQFKEGVISLAMGMENGAPVEGNLDNLKHFYDRGIRYITLAHSKSNHISDSSYDEERQWDGLSPFGEKVVTEMNRLGIMVDVSHLSDSAFYDVMRISEAPVVASHSSCRKFTPGWERNMSDEMIQLLAEKGGVICINFGSSFLKSEYQGSWTKAQKDIEEHLAKNGIEEGSAEAESYKQEYRRTHRKGTVQDVIDHIDHVVNLVGVDHVGFGSDFDGVFALPEGVEDVSQYPNIIYELLKKGYSEEDIEKICGGNMMRVWSEVEKHARQVQMTVK